MRGALQYYTRLLSHTVETHTAVTNRFNPTRLPFLNGQIPEKICLVLLKRLSFSARQCSSVQRKPPCFLYTTTRAEICPERFRDHPISSFPGRSKCSMSLQIWSKNNTHISPKAKLIKRERAETLVCQSVSHSQAGWCRHHPTIFIHHPKSIHTNDPEIKSICKV